VYWGKRRIEELESLLIKHAPKKKSPQNGNLAASLDALREGI